MRFRLADPGNANYLHNEPFWNNMKLIEVNSATELVLGVALVDANGNKVNLGNSGTIKYARINASTSGDNTLIAAVASKSLLVHAVGLIASGDVTATFESGTTSGELFGPLDITTNSGFVLPYSDAGWFKTVAGELLNLILDAAINVGGGLVYTEVD